MHGFSTKKTYAWMCLDLNPKIDKCVEFKFSMRAKIKTKMCTYVVLHIYVVVVYLAVGTQMGDSR